MAAEFFRDLGAKVELFVAPGRFAEKSAGSGDIEGVRIAKTAVELRKALRIPVSKRLLRRIEKADFEKRIDEAIKADRRFYNEAENVPGSLAEDLLRRAREEKVKREQAIRNRILAEVIKH